MTRPITVRAVMLEAAREEMLDAVCAARLGWEMLRAAVGHLVAAWRAGDAVVPNRRVRVDAPTWTCKGGDA